MIPFNIPGVVGSEYKYIMDAIQRGKLSGDGEYTSLCSKWFESKFDAAKVLLTTSCTHALEMAAILAEIGPGDEVIMPSYTFVSSANAFVSRGAKIIFVDIRPDTMNIDENLIEAAITSYTKAIVPVHYAGVSCDMDEIMRIADQYNLIVIEDAAQGVMSKYNGKYLGTIGHIGCYSFHETKNYNCGEGGAIVLNDARFVERAEIIREKGTDRSKFFRGQVDKYTWVDFGSSYLPSELNAAFLYAQLEEAHKINDDRLRSWGQYYNDLTPLVVQGSISIPTVPDTCEHNGHMFYIKMRDLNERTELLQFLQGNGVLAIFHYIPLHSAKAGRIYTQFNGEDRYTTSESERLLRLPLFYNIKVDEIKKITDLIYSFFNKKEELSTAN